MNAFISILGWHGRIGVAEWWAMVIVSVIIWLCYFNFIGFAPGDLMQIMAHGQQKQKVELLRMFAEPPPTAPFWSVGISLLAAWVFMVATIKRYHDLNLTGIMLLFRFLTVFGGVLALFQCAFFAGSEEDNGYQAAKVKKADSSDPKQRASAVSTARTALALKARTEPGGKPAPAPVAPSAQYQRSQQGGFGRRAR